MMFGFTGRKSAASAGRRRANRRDALLFDRLEPRQMMAGNTLSGTVLSGNGVAGKRLAHVQVSLYEAADCGCGSVTPALLGTATTRANGTFRISVPKATTTSLFYVTANLGGDVSLTSVLGTKLPKTGITVNELTTVATGFAMAQFSRTDGQIGGDGFGLGIAAGMYNNLVSSHTGKASSVLLSSPNKYETNSLRTLRSLGNLTAAMVRSQGLQRAALRSQFFAAATVNGTAPGSVFEAFANIAKNPGQNVADIYGMTRYSATYSNGLFQSPDAFTLTVVVNNSGSRKNMIGGPGQLVFDDSGTAWVTNNTIANTPNSSKFITVLQPNGAPAASGPKSPLFGGGTLGGGFGITIDPTNGNIWSTNYGWGRAPGNKPGLGPYDSGTGSVSVFSPTGVPLSGPKGLFGVNPTTGEFPAVKRAQGIQVDSQGNVYIASIENNSVVVFPKGDSMQAVSYKVPDAVWQSIDPTLNHFQSPFDVRLAADDSAWISFSGDLSDINAPGGFVRVKLNGVPGSYTVDPLFTPVATAPTAGVTNNALNDNYLHAPKGMVIDSQGNCWITSGPTDSIYKVPFDWSDTKDPLVDIKRYSGGGISGPWGLEVDGNDNIWVANFGPEGLGQVYTKPAISVLAGANAAKRPQGYVEGQPISSAVGYTVPTGGDQVLLANGDPLYGKGMPASYLPLQRLTQVRIDQGGNLWAINNWKPDFTWDATGEVLVGDKAKGGGGNSLVIFVGVAAPRPIEGWDPACSARRTGYAQLAPTLAQNPSQLNQPIGQARAEITAAAFGLDRSLVLTPQQTQYFLGVPGRRTAQQQLIWDCVNNLTNTTVNPIVRDVHGTRTNVILGSYGLTTYYDSTGRLMIQSDCASSGTQQAECLVFNSYLTGYIQKRMLEIGAYRSWRMMVSSDSFKKLAAASLKCQAAHEGACFTDYTLNGVRNPAGVALTPALWGVNFDLIYLLTKPNGQSYGADMPAYFSFIPDQVADALKASPFGIPYDDFIGYFPASTHQPAGN